VTSKTFQDLDQIKLAIARLQFELEMNLLGHLMVSLILILSLISTYLVFIAIIMNSPTDYHAQISQFHIVAQQTLKLLIVMTLVPVVKINGVLKQQQVQSATVVTMISTLIGMIWTLLNLKMEAASQRTHQTI